MKQAIFLLLIVVAACNSGVDSQESPKPENKFSDTTIRAIYDLQDRRETDSLINFLTHENAKYRESASLALASVQDSTALGPLTAVLSDSSTTVRLAAAYALGQLRSENAADSLLFALAWEDFPIVRGELLEALGKCLSEEQITDFLNHEPRDSLARAGFAWGLYRAGLRGIVTPRMVKLAIGCLYDNQSYDTRLGAAHFLGRSRDIELAIYQDTLLSMALTEPSSNVRMALASAMQHADEGFALQAIQQILTKENDYRVKINSIRALQNFADEKTMVIVKPLLKDSNPNLAQAAADFLATKLTSETLLTEAKKADFWRVRAALVGGAIAKGDTAAVTYCTTLIANSTNPYEKSVLLTALAQDIGALDLLVSEAFATDSNPVRTAAMRGVISIRRKEGLTAAQKIKVGEIFKRAIGHGDMAMVVTGASGLANDEWNYPSQFSDFQFLHEAKKKLSLPKDNEILQALQAAIDHFEGKEAATPVVNEFNHPIDWDFVAGIDEEQLVKVSTAKGDIILRMLVNDSPGSVANFLALADTGYYDNSVFHRIVPNFVAQGGDPRGDGWGGEDYSIRSEIGPLRYKTGSVGMASAGKDTEGVQWFITHSPTPHLDGRYSIFAVVTKGIDVVHQLELGDEIISIERIDE
jgi:cyclophilin family peptidyl-prolyl cis-trans isomerase/HEAT repeat protein